MTVAAVPSPCVSVCHMNTSSGYCEGCLRTIDEIATWSMMDDPAKQAVWRRLEARRAARPADAARADVPADPL